MKKYHGFLPFGGPVRAWINKQQIVLSKSVPEIWMVKSSTTYLDHVNLQMVTHELADAKGVPTQTINNEMYIEGLKIKKEQKALAQESEVTTEE